MVDSDTWMNPENSIVYERKVPEKGKLITLQGEQHEKDVFSTKDSVL